MFNQLYFVMMLESMILVCEISYTFIYTANPSHENYGQCQTGIGINMIEVC